MSEASEIPKSRDFHVGPATVVLGILLGSSFAIAFGLSVVSLLFWILRGEHDRLTAELPELLRSTLMFTVLAGAAALSFFGVLRRSSWRHWATASLLIGLVLIGRYYWPR